LLETVETLETILIFIVPLWLIFYFFAKKFTTLEDFKTNERYAKIVEDSRNLFLKYGYKSVTMDDVARELGVSKKTLYQYVSNKAELIEKTLEYDIYMMGAWVEEDTSPNLNAIDHLLMISRKVNKDFDELSPSLIFDLKKYYPDLFKKHIEVKKQVVYLNMKKNIEWGIQQGLYRDNLDIDLVAGLYINKMIALHNNDLDFLENLTFENIFEVMFENHIRGIANKEGTAYFEQQKEKIKNRNN